MREIVVYELLSLDGVAEDPDGRLCRSGFGTTDEVLEFKRENGREHRRYMESLRTFALDLSLLAEVDRARALHGPQADLQDQASDLRKLALAAWKSPKDVSGFGLGFAGAAWSLAAHNPVPAALGILGAGLKMLPSGAEGSVYSYLFRASRSLP